MKLLTYDEALDRAENKNWFINFYSKDEVCTDQEVREANELARSISATCLKDFFGEDADVLLLNIYYDNLMDYLEDLKYNFVSVKK